MPVPSNLTCLTAATFPALPNTVTLDVSLAPADAGSPCPTCAGDCAARFSQVWYVWVAPTDGIVVFDTLASSYDTLLAAWTGACGGLTEVACSEDYGAGTTSQIVFTAIAGTPYYLSVSSFTNPGGTLVLNAYYGTGTGSCFDAIAIDDLPYATTMDVSANTADPSVCPSCAGNCDGFSAQWFTWTSTFPQTVVIDCCTSTYDTMLSVWQGLCGSSEFEEVACSEDCDGCGDGTQSKLQFNTRADVQYSIFVASYDDPGASLVFSMTSYGEVISSVEFGEDGFLQVQGGYVPPTGVSRQYSWTAWIAVDAEGSSRTIFDTAPGPTQVIGCVGGVTPTLGTWSHTTPTNPAVLANGPWTSFLFFGVRAGKLTATLFNGGKTGIANCGRNGTNVTVTASTALPIDVPVLVAWVIDWPGSNTVTGTSTLYQGTRADDGTVTVASVGVATLPAYGVGANVDCGAWYYDTTATAVCGVAGSTGVQFSLGTSHDADFLAQNGNLWISQVRGYTTALNATEIVDDACDMALISINSYVPLRGLAFEEPGCNNLSLIGASYVDETILSIGSLTPSPVTGCDTIEGGCGADPSIDVPVPPAPTPTTHRRLIRRCRRAPHLSTEQLWNFYSKLQIDLEAGNGIISGQGSNPILEIRWSDDGGHNFSNWHFVESGKLGEYTRRAILWRMGRSRDRVYEVCVSDPVQWTLINAYLDMERGTS